MIRLDKTTRKLQIVLGGAKTTNDCDVTVSYYDVPSQTKPTFEEYRGATQVASSNGTTDADICAAPSINGTVRNVDTIHVYNKDTANVQATVKMVDSTGPVTTILVRQTLTTLQTLMYEHGAGWKIL